MRPILLHLAHHSILAGHPGKRRMYDSLRRAYYCPNIVAEAYCTVKSYMDCPIIGTKLWHERKLGLFSSSGPLQFVAVGILGPLLRTTSGSQFLVIITNRYVKFTWAIHTVKIMSTQVVIFFKHWAIPYGIPRHNLIWRWTAVCKLIFHINVRISRNEKFHNHCVLSPANEQVRRYDRTLVSRHRPYVADHRPNWDHSVQRLTYTCHCRTHRSLSITLLSWHVTNTPLAQQQLTVVLHIHPMLIEGQVHKHCAQSYLKSWPL